ncbi:MAG: helix-turn-helix domain-containing protein [Traorella sp.]
MIKKLSVFLEKEMNRQGIKSASKLAKLCDNKISSDFINKIKRQEPQTVTLETLSILANGLHMSLKELLEKSNIIEDYGNYGLSTDEANHLIEELSSLLVEHDHIDLSSLSNHEKIDLANRTYEYIKMISYMYK